MELVSKSDRANLSERLSLDLIHQEYWERVDWLAKSSSLAVGIGINIITPKAHWYEKGLWEFPNWLSITGEKSSLSSSWTQAWLHAQLNILDRVTKAILHNWLGVECTFFLHAFYWGYYSIQHLILYRLHSYRFSIPRKFSGLRCKAIES
jgi:hypothetical protein